MDPKDLVLFGAVTDVKFASSLSYKGRLGFRFTVRGTCSQDEMAGLVSRFKTVRDNEGQFAGIPIELRFDDMPLLVATATDRSKDL